MAPRNYGTEGSGQAVQIEVTEVADGRSSNGFARSAMFLAVLASVGFLAFTSTGNLQTAPRGAAFNAVDDDLTTTSDDDDYAVGSLAPSFSVTTIQNTTWQYKYDATLASTPIPLIVMALNPKDSSLMTMVTDVTSIDNFLSNSPTETNYLFVGYGDEGVSAVQKLQERFSTRMEDLGLSAEKKADWFSRLAFSAESMEKLEGKSSTLPTILHQGSWRSPYTYVSVNSSSSDALYQASRVDGDLGFCGRPSGESDVSLVYLGDACRPLHNLSLAGNYVLITTSSCSSTDAILNVVDQTGADGVILMAQEGEAPVSVGREASGSITQAVTSVSYEVGAALVKLFESGETSVSVSFGTVMVPGYFMGIDSERKLYQLGYWWESSMNYITLEARYLQYMTTVYERESKAGYVIPLFSDTILDPESVATIDSMPSETLMRSFETMELDMQLTCDGDLDQDCSKWDHVITLDVSCWSSVDSVRHRRLHEVGGDYNEMGRWITPFRRQVGHWLTDITPLMPMLFEDTCNFTLEITESKWVASLSLRFTDTIDASTTATPSVVMPVSYPNTNTDFDSVSSYNANRTVEITTPSETGTIEKVILEAIISGHGDCEFEPTAHFWSMNGVTVANVSFFGAGSAYGCSDQVIEGIEPDEHGTWWYGRDGWCDGAPVQPHLFDITEHMKLDADSSNILSYNAKSYGDDDGRWEASIMHEYEKPTSETDGCGGYILMSTNLIFYTTESSR